MSACKTIEVSTSYREHTCDSVALILSQSGYSRHETGQTLGSECGLMEMSEVKHAHLQHLLQVHTEAQPPSPDVGSHLATVMVKDATGSTMISPLTPSKAIDLSISTDEHCRVMPGEKTPTTYGEVPGFVLARARDEESLTAPHSSRSSQMQSKSTARVCLEKRFDAMSADAPRQQDSAFLCNFLTCQQSAEAQEAVIHPQMQMWMKTDRANPLEMMGHIQHMVEPYQQCLYIPMSLSSHLCPERLATDVHDTSGSSSTEEQQLVIIENAVATPAAASMKQESTHSSQPTMAAHAAPESGSRTRKRAHPPVSQSQCKERHNSKERERRRKIRLCCDELNMLVPFCDFNSDKVTTLQWTTAFLRYINQAYGHSLKEEFEKIITDERAFFVKPRPSSVQNPTHQEMNEPLTNPLAAEQ